MVRSRELTPISIYQSKSPPRLESHSFLERALLHVGDTWLASDLTLSEIVDTEKEKKSGIIIRFTDLYAITNPCAFLYAIEVVIISDEPALVAEPGWLQVSRLVQ